jgi:hypothetical protein
MNTSRCAYCGGPAENPVQLGFTFNEDDQEVAVHLPLCLACSQSWCPQPPVNRPSEARKSDTASQWRGPVHVLD